jgi:LytR cell envelope-related transcriptional attenuator
VHFRIVPAVPIEIGGVDYLQLENPQADLLFERIRKGQPLGQLGVSAVLTTISPANVTVQVMDANSGGAAQQVVDFLEKAGFVVLPLQTAPPELTMSEILWRRTSAEEKEVVASYLTLLPTRQDKNHTRSTAVTVVVGSDFPGLEGVSG